MGRVSRSFRQFGVTGGERAGAGGGGQESGWRAGCFPPFLPERSQNHEGAGGERELTGQWEQVRSKGSDSSANACKLELDNGLSDLLRS